MVAAVVALSHASALPPPAAFVFARFQLPVAFFLLLSPLPLLLRVLLRSPPPTLQRVRAPRVLEALFLLLLRVNFLVSVEPSLCVAVLERAPGAECVLVVMRVAGRVQKEWHQRRRQTHVGESMM